MKNIAAIILSVLIFSQVSAQSTSQTQIIPGKGIGELLLGISSEKAIEILGQPEKSRNYQQEQDEEVVKFGKNVSLELCYNTHYDRVLKYKNTAEANIKYPVYKLYFRNNKLVYMVLTSYGYNTAVYEKLKIKNNLKFHNSGEAIKKSMGYPEITQERYVGEYLYMQNGIDFLTEQNELRAVFIYEPIETEVAQAIKQMSGY